MCMYPEDQKEPKDKDCPYGTGSNNLLIPLAEMRRNESQIFKLRVHPVGKMIEDGNYTFNLIQTTQLSETILPSGIWITEVGKFVAQVYTAYFSSSTKLISFFIESQRGTITGTYKLFSLEDFPGQKVKKFGDIDSGLYSNFITEEIIASRCDSKKTSIVSQDYLVRPQA
jgi:hypothetical protein